MSGMTSSLNSHRTHSVSSLPCAAACDGGRPPADTQPHSVGKPCRNHLKQAPKPAIAVACSWSCFLSGQLQSSTVHFPEVSQLRGLLGGVLRGVAGGGGLLKGLLRGLLTGLQTKSVRCGNNHRGRTNIQSSTWLHTKANMTNAVWCQVLQKGNCPVIAASNRDEHQVTAR